MKIQNRLQTVLERRRNVRRISLLQPAFKRNRPTANPVQKDSHHNKKCDKAETGQ